MMRYKLIGSNMVERPTKGEWVRYDDVKPFIDYAERKIKEDDVEIHHETDINDKRRSK
jgi:hypothetical protein